MSEVRLVKFSFKPGKKQTWLDWCAELKRREKESLATLKDEGVLSESCFVSADGKSLFYFMEAKDIAKSKEVATKSKHKIDAEHKKKKEECIEKVEVLENVLNLSRKA